MLQTKKIEGKIGFIVTDQSNVDPYSDFQFWETLRVTSELLKRPPLAAAHAVGKIYEVPPPRVRCSQYMDFILGVCSCSFE